jgi:indolepyruvate ferredoxin oxidoreductase alpha subunit
MVPQNAIRQHRILKSRLTQAKKLVNESEFNVLEDNGKDVGIIGSGIGFYHAKSLLDTKQFSWLKLGFVYPFPHELVRKFASKLKRIIVVEELRPYVEDSLRGFNVEVLGKDQLGLEEIGEFNPDGIRAAFAKLGYLEPPKLHSSRYLESPRALSRGALTEPSYYALNTVNPFVSCDAEKCVGCDICELACSWEKTVF